MRLEQNAKLVMVGDSITDCGRARPTAEGLFDPLGSGYVSFVEGMLAAVYPQRMIRVVNAGTSGNTVRDLVGRWQAEVLDLKPSWVSCMIGINDVWRQFDSPRMLEQHVPPDEYESKLGSLVVQTTARQIRMVLLTPYFIEPNRADPMRAAMDRYGEIMKKLAKTYSCLLVDTQAAFDLAMQSLHPMSLAWDRIHCNRAGHFLIARAFLKAIDFTF